MGLGLLATLAGVPLGCGGSSQIEPTAYGGGGSGAGTHSGGTGGSAGTGGGSGGCSVPAGGEADGNFFLVISMPLDRSAPVLFDVRLTTTGQMLATELRLTLQAIDATNRQTTVGELGQYGPIDVGPAGEFEATMAGVSVPGVANPYSSNQLVLSPTLTGTLCRPADFLCGDARGVVTAPITYDMAGSTYTLTRVDALEGYPEPPVINCEGDTARPL